MQVTAQSAPGAPRGLPRPGTGPAARCTPTSPIAQAPTQSLMLTPQQIPLRHTAKLPKTPLSTTSASRQMLHDSLSCSICLEALVLSGRERRALPCSHVFHADCVEQWLRESGACPVCRHDAAAVEEGGISVRGGHGVRGSLQVGSVLCRLVTVKECRI